MGENLKIEFSETNKGKEQVIINIIFKFNFSTLKKNNSKLISNFPFINLEYMNDIYNKIKKYFGITYLKDYYIKHWNYYDNIEHITNNALESSNNYLNDLFPKKSSIL
ncbi:hypothetical protein H8356DRAFT_1391055 [Neocallimastix lanati (nom. inval.)]|nr:hypothetical protein H8356DRAFT_1391055 [Neocallimastix sp. JGI-2020a]